MLWTLAIQNWFLFYPFNKMCRRLNKKLYILCCYQENVVIIIIFATLFCRYKYAYQTMLHRYLRWFSKILLSMVEQLLKKYWLKTRHLFLVAKKSSNFKSDNRKGTVSRCLLTIRANTKGFNVCLIIRII